MGEPVRFMQQLVSLDFKIVTNPVQARFEAALRDGRMIGHRCPSCAKVYVPPKGFCPLCVVETTDADELDVADRGTVVSFTVLTPIQYRGQKERDPYALASILLDGADSTIGQQRLAGLPLDKVRTGLRVGAEWAPEEERRGTDPGMARFGMGTAVRHWAPTGEPDTPRAQYQDHIL